MGTTGLNIDINVKGFWKGKLLLSVNTFVSTATLKLIVTYTCVILEWRLPKNTVAGSESPFEVSDPVEIKIVQVIKLNIPWKFNAIL